MINIETISLNIISDDIDNFKKNLLINFNNQIVIDYLNELTISNSLNDIVILTGKTFDELASYQLFNEAFILQNLLQRYTYLLTTKNDFNNFNVNNSSERNELIYEVCIPFFKEQIDYYTTICLEKMNSFNAISWNKVWLTNLSNSLISLIQENDFIVKLETTENLSLIFEDEPTIFANLGLDGEKPEKEAFIFQLQELKIIFQTMNILIQNLFKEIIGEKSWI